MYSKCPTGLVAVPEAGFERRMARYNSGLFWSYDQRVITLVVLADLCGFRPAS